MFVENYQRPSQIGSNIPLSCKSQKAQECGRAFYSYGAWDNLSLIFEYLFKAALSGNDMTIFGDRGESAAALNCVRLYDLAACLLHLLHKVQTIPVRKLCVAGRRASLPIGMGSWCSRSLWHFFHFTPEPHQHRAFTGIFTVGWRLPGSMNSAAREGWVLTFAFDASS